MRAYVYFTKTKKYAQVNAAEIIKFNPEKDFDKKVFSVKLSDGSTAKCQVLIVAETTAQLEELISSKRVKVPKLSQSMFDDDDEDQSQSFTDAEQPLSEKSQIKSKKTLLSQQRKNAERGRMESIVKAYTKSKTYGTGLIGKENNILDVDLLAPVKHNQRPVSTSTSGLTHVTTNQSQHNDAVNCDPSSGDETPDGLGQDSPKHPLVVSNPPKQVSANYHTRLDSCETPDMFGSEDNDNLPEKISSQAPVCSSECWLSSDDEGDHTDVDYNEINSKQQLQRQMKILNTRIIKLKEKCSKLRQIVLQLRNSYQSLKESESFPLTEKTGQKLLALIEKLSDKKNANSLEGSEDSSNDDADLTDHTHLTAPVRIKNVALAECKRVRTPSKFVITMAYGLWGYKALAKKTVREQSNMIGKTLLTPRKKEMIAHKLKEWLTERQYGERAISLEMENLNTYLGRAITGARRHINRISAGPTKEPDAQHNNNEIPK